jgi:hypothetical protein
MVATAAAIDCVMMLSNDKRGSLVNGRASTSVATVILLPLHVLSTRSFTYKSPITSSTKTAKPTRLQLTYSKDAT